jgi:competence protein ComEA
MAGTRQSIRAGLFDMGGNMQRLSFVLGVLMVFALALPATQAQEKAEKPKPAASASTPINLNTATVAQLETLPGIGARTAQLIVEHRQKNGGFKKVEELMNIKGIGEKSFLKIKALVTVGDKAGTEEKR